MGVLDGDKYRIGIAVEGIPGYFPTDYPAADSLKAAQAWADSLNARMDLTPQQAIEIVLTTLRGGGA